MGLVYRRVLRENPWKCPRRLRFYILTALGVVIGWGCWCVGVAYWWRRGFKPTPSKLSISIFWWNIGLKAGFNMFWLSKDKMFLDKLCRWKCCLVFFCHERIACGRWGGRRHVEEWRCRNSSRSNRCLAMGEVGKPIPIFQDSLFRVLARCINHCPAPGVTLFVIFQTFPKKILKQKAMKIRFLKR